MEDMRGKIIKALQKAIGIKDVQLEFSEREEHGDYSSNIAMQLFSKHQATNTKHQTPRSFAQEIVKKISADSDLKEVVDRVEVAGPGFINFFLSEKALLTELKEIIEKKGKYGSSLLGKGKTVVIDYSSPNIAKRFSIGHLRSTIIGQALYNLYSFLGYKTIGDNHLGDWGTQFGMIIAQVKRKGLDVDKLSVNDLEKLYVEFNREIEKDSNLKDEAKKWFKKLEDGEKEAKDIWQKVYDISIAEFNRIYKLLGVDIDHAYGESFYRDKTAFVIEEAKKKGVLKESQGAKVVEFEDMPPAMLVKSDGATTYFTRDLAAIKFRIEKWDPDLIIYEVGAEQKLHFQQVFKAAELLGWKDKRQFVHIAHGLIRFEHGKMSTRKGQTIKLEDVIKEAIKNAREIIDRGRGGEKGVGRRKKEELAKMVGIGAIKYFDLMHHPTSDIVFDWKKMFVLEGKSAPYLQYTVARTKSVLAKSKKQKTKSRITDKYLKIEKTKLNAEELGVMRCLARFPEIIVDAAKNYSPNVLADYLFVLAQKYNAFYSKHKIIGNEKQVLRLCLTQAVGQVLKNGLMLLGIEAPQRM